MGERESGALRLDFDRRLKLEFHGSKVTSDAGFLPFRKLDTALGLTEAAGECLVDPRTGRNGQHGMVGLFRQSTFGRLGGYEDVNDADRLGHDPAMRWIVGGGAVAKQAALASQMGRFETEFLAADDNIAALADLSGLWIDRVHDRRPPKKVVLDMDSSVSPTYGDQESTAYNGHFGCTCYHPLFLFNQFGDLGRCSLRPGNVHSMRAPMFEVFSQRYERGSIIVTSNLPFEEWPSVFRSERLTGALLDRLTHHVHILEMNGDSYRLKQSAQRRRSTAGAEQNQATAAPGIDHDPEAAAHQSAKDHRPHVRYGATYGRARERTPSSPIGLKLRRPTGRKLNRR